MSDHEDHRNGEHEDHAAHAAARPLRDHDFGTWRRGELGSRGSAQLAAAARDRAEYMRPWASEPHSIAASILDDETYDWLGVFDGMRGTGGSPVVSAESEIERAHELMNDAGIAASATGSSSARFCAW